jgi:redox-sensitive bicupin YhaK (pirin superfamily)
MLARQLQPAPREIVYRTKGHGHGPITRLMNPSGLGELLKPFVFLDLAQFDGRLQPMPMDFFWHPHSGIATVTVLLEGGLRFKETTGRDGALPGGGIEWMRASNGVWHTGEPEVGRVSAFQLWVALPPELENAPFASQYLMPNEVPADGPVRVMLGSYGKLTSPITAPAMTYLQVRLQAGQRWTYVPPPGHSVAWVALQQGLLYAPSAITAGEIAAFAPSEAPIDFLAREDTVFVLGSAAKHPHPLVMGNYSVHTNARALQQGEAEIRRVGESLVANGTLKRPVNSFV